MAVFHTSGYAEVDANTLNHGGKVQLRTWARIEGRLMLGNRPGARQAVLAQASGEDYFARAWRGDAMIFSILSRTDSDGRFVLERVPPVGPVHVGRFLAADGSPGNQSSGGAVTPSAGQTINLSPGQTANVILGGMGRAVVGKVDIPSALVGQNDWTWQGYILSHEGLPPRWPMPDDVRNPPPSRDGVGARHF
jgi:hypothetical protein